MALNEVKSWPAVYCYHEEMQRLVDIFTSF